jgi:environmental stress-induced protein Ves
VTRASEPRWKVIKRGRYRAMRWRNGRGRTLEIAREPAAGQKFAWRLSLAEIEHDCDFSAYPGYRRALVLAGGNALRLHFRGRGTCSLGAARRYVRFDGSWNTRCAIPDGRCTDLSLIVASRAAGPAGILRAPVDRVPGRGVRVVSSGSVGLVLS